MCKHNFYIIMLLKPVLIFSLKLMFNFFKSKDKTHIVSQGKQPSPMVSHHTRRPTKPPQDDTALQKINGFCMAPSTCHRKMPILGIQDRVIDRINTGLNSRVSSFTSSSRQGTPKRGGAPAETRVQEWSIHF